MSHNTDVATVQAELFSEMAELKIEKSDLVNMIMDESEVKLDIQLRAKQDELADLKKQLADAVDELSKSLEVDQGVYRKKLKSVRVKKLKQLEALGFAMEDKEEISVNCGQGKLTSTIEFYNKGERYHSIKLIDTIDASKASKKIEELKADLQKQIIVVEKAVCDVRIAQANTARRQIHAGSQVTKVALEQTEKGRAWLAKLASISNTDNSRLLEVDAKPRK
jgi:hypothetical protein